MAKSSKEIAIFGAGCFWGIEQVFRNTKGVIKTSVGYSGGRIENPTYKEVCSGLTGHAEVVKLLFDKKIILYQDLLKVFWNSHNPTTPNQQGLNTGSQYRSIIFYNNDFQKKEAMSFKKKIESKNTFFSNIITEIIPEAKFYIAEDYHQQYFEKKGGGSCHI